MKIEGEFQALSITALTIIYKSMFRPAQTDFFALWVGLIGEGPGSTDTTNLNDNISCVKQTNTYVKPKQKCRTSILTNQLSM